MHRSVPCSTVACIAGSNQIQSVPAYNGSLLSSTSHLHPLSIEQRIVVSSKQQRQAFLILLISTMASIGHLHIQSTPRATQWHSQVSQLTALYNAIFWAASQPCGSARPRSAYESYSTTASFPDYVYILSSLPASALPQRSIP